MSQLMDGDPEFAGSFALVARLGTGAAGPLFLGESVGLHGLAGWQVAVRVVRERLAAGDELRARLTREVAAARRAGGPNLAPLVGAGLEGPRPWVAWEYLPGPSLATVMSQREALPMSQVAALATGLAGALHALHGAGVIHGDLHPGNVFVCDGVPRLTGFGTSSATVAALAAVRPSPAARDFLAPEQAAGRQATEPGDVFSLAAVLVRATGEKGPFCIGGQGAAWVNLGGVPPEIRPLVARCLDVDPGRRPTAAEVRAVALAACAGVAPIPWPAEEPAPEPVPVAPVPATRAAAPPPQLAAAQPQPPPGHGTTRRRAATWAVVACAVIVALVLLIGWAATSNGPTPPVSGAVQLYYASYQAGDCLYGPADLNSGASWPDPAWQVPCGQRHTYEVLYANQSYWPQGEAYPGASAVEDRGKAECDARFAAYVGLPRGSSRYDYTDVMPWDSGSWASGSRSLVCIAFLPSGADTNGVMFTGSVKGAHR